MVDSSDFAQVMSEAEDIARSVNQRLTTAHVLLAMFTVENRAALLLKERGVDSVWLEVSVENQAAIRFYQKHGYRQLRRIPRYYLDRIDAWVMRRDF